MRTYARIQSDTVAELFTTSQDISKLFHQNLLWVEVTNLPQVRVGWIYSGGQFEPPVQAAVPAANAVLQLQAQVADLAQQVAALAKSKP
ncbi:MAG: hypothetical protein JOZ58_13320 [Acetobacteraceae bacterium]|nr:hypothetical protein [Acetobacteraceae bacterium]MBV8576000.1 hypothetical protein [Acetobacteraceae bacterium]